MPHSTNTNPDDLQLENAALHSELMEYRQLMEAIRSGDLDALVMSGGEGIRLAPLEQADNTWRRMIEEMGEGALVLTEEGAVSYANRATAALLEVPLSNVIGSDIEQWFDPESREAFTALLSGALQNRESVVRRGDFRWQRTGKDALHVHVTLSVLYGAQKVESISLVVVDLSAQEHNAAIAAEERLSRAILEQATEAIVVCDETGTVIKASHSARNRCECSPLGLPFTQSYTLRDPSGKRLDVSDLTTLAGEAGMEVSLRHNDNDLRIKVNAGPLIGPENEYIGSVITLTDVDELARAERQARSARDELAQELDKANQSRRALLSVLEDARRTEQALKDSEAHFRLALENLPLSVWNMDARLRYVWVHDHELGKDAESILGRTDADLFEPEDAERITKIKRKVLETGEPLTHEVSVVAGGKRQTYTLFIEPQHDTQGNIDGLIGAALNVTETRELESTRRKLSEALFHSATPIALADTRNRFELVNDAFIELFGYTQQELQGQPVSLIAPGEDEVTPRPAQVLEELDRSGIFRGEVLRRSKDGEIIPLYLTLAPILDENDRRSGLVGTFNDLRPYKASEARARGALTDTISAISLTVEKRDPYTAGHQQRVAELAKAISVEMGLDAGQIEGVYLGTLIHDIGKIYIPAEILNRPGKLSEYEFGMIRSHPEVGYEIIKDVKFDWPIADIVYQHHERMNGSGYPQGLKGEEILLEARIVAVADVVEAMTSHRPYRPGLGIDTALAQIEKEAGTTLDRDIVAICLRLFREKEFAWRD